MRPKTATALLALLVFPLAAFAQEAARPSLSGVWVLDEEQSETLREKLGELLEEQNANPRAQARWNRVQERGRARVGNAPFGRLEIAHAEPSVTIVYRGGRLRELYTDGREIEPDAEYGEQSVTASWEGPRLVVDAQTARGRVTEFWELSDDGRRLFVTTQADVGERFEGPVSFVRVYDAEPPEDASTGTESEAEADEPGDR